MADTVTTVANDNDDWEVAVDSGEFDKRHEQQEKARAANQEPVITSVSSSGNDDDSRTSSSINLMKSNKPIRILKRPTSQSQLPTNNDLTKSSTTTTTTSPSTGLNSTTANSNSPSSNNTSSSTTVPIVSIIPRIQTKDSTNSTQSVNTSSSSQASKPPIKTYEQREMEYRLARLRIMGEEESSAKDDDDLPAEPTPVPTDDHTKVSTSSAASTTRTTSKTTGPTHQSLQCHSTPGSYASNLYALNNVPSNTGSIHFTPNNTNNSTPSLGTGLFSSPNIPQNYRGAYPAPYSHLPPPPAGASRYPFATTTTSTLYMTSTAPFVSASPSSVSSSHHYPPQQQPTMSTNNWYNYQHSQTPSGAQQFGHPQ